MKIQRLSWAGLKIESGGQVLLIDAVQHYQGRGSSIGPADPFQFIDNTHADVVLITHLHSDHYEKEVVTTVLKPGGKFIASDQIAAELRADGLQPDVLAIGEPVKEGVFNITPVFAMDGVGDKQVSWVIEDGHQRILHGGDTMWHNQFWQLGKTYGNFDAVFLPTNGAVLNIPRVNFSPVPITLTPLQAITATRLLNARMLVPIHYGFNNPGSYEEHPDMEKELRDAALVQNVLVKWVQPGEYVPPAVQLHEK